MGYIDKKGYKRHSNHSNLWHRKVAYHKIYLKNRDKYPFKFEEYEVHHKDGNKKNNSVENLEIVTPEEHIDRHEEMQKNKEEKLRIIAKERSQDYKEGANFFDWIGVIMLVVGIGIFFTFQTIKTTGIVIALIGSIILFISYKFGRKKIIMTRKEIEEEIIERNKY